MKESFVYFQSQLEIIAGETIWSLSVPNVLSCSRDIHLQKHVTYCFFVMPFTHTSDIYYTRISLKKRAELMLVAPIVLTSGVNFE